MSFLVWVLSLVSPSTKNARRRPQRCKAVSPRLVLECLEDRVTPSTVVFSDDFNSETQSLNHTPFANWKVTQGSVDMIGTGFFDYYPGNGNYVDMEGSTEQGGTIQTNQAFAPGVYTLQFNLGNTPTSTTNFLTVSLGTYSETFSRTGTVPLDLITRTVTVSTPSPLVFSAPLSDTDNAGVILDNVLLTQPDLPPTVNVPGTQTAYENVASPIGGLSVGDVTSSTLTITLNVNHGTLALGTTTGLNVSGNGTSALSLFGSIADLNAALGSLSYQGALNYSGSDVLSITASDDSLSTSASVAINVKSVAQQAADLQAQVDTLFDAGVLNQGQANALDVKLDLNGNHGDVGKVQSFLNQVNALQQAGILTAEQANALLASGTTLLSSLTPTV